MCLKVQGTLEDTVGVLEKVVLDVYDSPYFAPRVAALCFLTAFFELKVGRIHSENEFANSIFQSALHLMTRR